MARAEAAAEATAEVSAHRCLWRSGMGDWGQVLVSLRRRDNPVEGCTQGVLRLVVLAGAMMCSVRHEQEDVWPSVR